MARINEYIVKLTCHLDPSSLSSLVIRHLFHHLLLAHAGIKLVLLIHIFNAQAVYIMLLVCNLLHSIRCSFLHMLKVVLYSAIYQVMRVLEIAFLSIL